MCTKEYSLDGDFENYCIKLIEDDWYPVYQKVRQNISAINLPIPKSDKYFPSRIKLTVQSIYILSPLISRIFFPLQEMELLYLIDIQF